MKQTIVLFFLFLFAISCQEEIEPNFSFTNEQEEITIDGNEKAEVTFSFSSSREWEATTTSDWLSISPTSGDAGSHQITLTATSENTTGTTRTATVLLSSLSLTHEVTVKQQATDFVELEQATYQVPAAGDILNIQFSTNVEDDELAIYGSATWLTQEVRTRSTNSYIVSLRALPNTDKSSRTAYILFYKETEGTQTLLNTVTIVQEGTASGTSTDYSADKQVRILQQASLGKGLPIVIMGDGFIDTDIADGTYDTVMDKTLENLFTEEPLKSLRDYFNVYAITAVSKNNNFGSGFETAFSCELEGGNSTGISGNDEAVMEYVESIEGVDLEEVLAVVILNSSAYAGTTYFGYSDGSKAVEFAIAYCPVIDNLESESFRQVLVHEAVGHGFTKLEDEYSYEENGSIPASEIKSVKELQALGWALNVDFTTDENEVLWSDFLKDSRYTSEGIGIYEGACTYISGAYRPTYESMMNSNINGFNAPSRKAMYDMVMKRATEQEPTYEDFVTFDLPIQAQTRYTTRAASAMTKPLPRPHFVNKKLISNK